MRGLGPMSKRRVRLGRDAGQSNWQSSLYCRFFHGVGMGEGMELSFSGS